MKRPYKLRKTIGTRLKQRFLQIRFRFGDGALSYRVMKKLGDCDCVHTLPLHLEDSETCDGSKIDVVFT